MAPATKEKRTTKKKVAKKPKVETKVPPKGHLFPKDKPNDADGAQEYFIDPASQAAKKCRDLMATHHENRQAHARATLDITESKRAMQAHMKKEEIPKYVYKGCTPHLVAVREEGEETFEIKSMKKSKDDEA